jgi:hypothetical protein
MRILLTVLVLMTFLLTRAQSHLPIDTWGPGYTQWQPFFPYPSTDSGSLRHHWQVRTFASLSAGYMFFKGGGMSYVSAPIGVIAFRPLTNNFTAFGSVSAAPVIFNFSSFPGNNVNRPYTVGVNARVEGGLIYTNDARTFSISGSVGVERGSYPAYPNNRPAPKKQ